MSDLRTLFACWHMLRAGNHVLTQCSTSTSTSKQMSEPWTPYSLTFWNIGGGVVCLAGFHYLASYNDQTKCYLSTVSEDCRYMNSCLPGVKWVCSCMEVDLTKPMKSLTSFIKKVSCNLVTSLPGQSNRYICCGHLDFNVYLKCLVFTKKHALPLRFFGFWIIYNKCLLNNDVRKLVLNFSHNKVT